MATVSRVVGEERSLAGRYRLIESIASGGMGTIWRARDDLLDRDVAAKGVRLPPELDERERAEACARAVREARAVAAEASKGPRPGRPRLVVENLS